MPTPQKTLARIERALPALLQNFGTPCFVYDKQGILDRGAELKHAMRDLPGGFQQMYPVKAWDNPENLRIHQSMRFGFDCSSPYEMHLMEMIGAQGNFILNSNNSRSEWFNEAMRLKGTIILDDVSLIKKVRNFPELIGFRVNPGKIGLSGGLESFGKPWEQKYGIMWEQLIPAFREVRVRGARRFGIHMMTGSNCLDEEYFVGTLKILLKAASLVEKATKIPFDFVDVGGGFGTPYKFGVPELNVHRIGQRFAEILTDFQCRHGYAPKLYTEMGRWMTGPFGVLVVSAINRKEIYQTHVGVDAGMNALMRHGMYGAHHEIKVIGAERRRKTEVVNVVGQICENIDRLATQRLLPVIRIGDTLFVLNAGAHSIVMVFRYNGTMAPPEVMLDTNRRLRLIRRAVTFEDLDATLHFTPKSVQTY